MYKVLLVDDNINVVEGLKSSIDWAKYNCEIPQTAMNGAEGLQKAIELKPDIIISDITMPVMDGIQMAKQVREIFPDIKLVFLTCHDDFEHARDAIKLNAVEYLIKVTMTKEDIYLMLEKITRELENGNKEKEKEQGLSIEINQNRYLFGESIISDLINEDFYKSDDFVKRLNIYGYKLDKNWFVLSVLKLDNYVELIEDNIYEDMNLVKFAILNVVEESINKTGSGEVFYFRKNEFILIYNYDQENKANQLTKIRKISLEVQSNIRKAIESTCTVYIGRQYDSLLKTSKAYEELRQLNNIRFYHQDEKIFEQGCRPMEFTTENESLTGLVGSFVESLDEFDISKIEESISNLVKNCCDLSLDMYMVKNTIEKMLMALLNFIGKSGYNEHDLTSIPFSEIIKYTDNIFTFKNILIKLSKKTLLMITKNAPSYINNEMKKITQYVNAHLQEDISLDFMASYANMNSSYFSRYFKNKAGENFVEYLARTRIEKAQKMLCETELTIDEIVELVGHVNKAYFTRVFKKFTKTTPGEYRKLKRRRFKNENIQD